MERNSKTRILAEGAIMVAMAFVLSYIKVFRLPWGGSITLLSMLPIAVYSVKRGVKAGLFAAFVSSLLQLGQGIIVDGLFAWGLTPVMLVACIFLDYIGAYTAIGLAGMFRNKGLAGRLGGTAIAILIRYILHVVSGAAIFHSAGMIWEAFSTDNEWLYSAVYNGAYMLPEMIFTVIGAAVLLKVPQINRLIGEN
ncbi:MAG: energy-coupled thiamine transporter ThiT [Ruminococcus sp.]|nr:energy-coupled thiamine transporter ThiT [Ruminococcus sp.]MCM1380532.1 energy-coupled thiamine transporter ThiT [Muribaculaceae bacterium]MCM1479125.1 energy-coupled thiamine transporter ThiT [Muribaculaceae bacterium]